MSGAPALPAVRIADETKIEKLARRLSSHAWDLESLVNGRWLRRHERRGGLPRQPRLAAEILLANLTTTFNVGHLIVRERHFHLDLTGCAQKLSERRTEPTRDMCTALRSTSRSSHEPTAARGP